MRIIVKTYFDQSDGIQIRFENKLQVQKRKNIKLGKGWMLLVRSVDSSHHVVSVYFLKRNNFIFVDVVEVHTNWKEE